MRYSGREVVLIERMKEQITAAIMARLNQAERNGEPSEFCDGLRIAADIAADTTLDS